MFTAVQAQLLTDTSVTCALQTTAGTFLVSAEHGIRPPLLWLRGEPAQLRGAVVADRVIGLAAAMLFAHGAVTAVSAEVMSRPALDFLRAQGIHAAYGTLVPEIQNRAGDGICPMEQKAQTCKTPAQAFALFHGMLP
jgi:hypothetical protein